MARSELDVAILPEAEVRDNHPQHMEVHRHEQLMETETADGVADHVLTHTANTMHGGELI